MRHGSRTAASPPGSGTLLEVTDPLESNEIGDEELTAPHMPSAP